MALSRLSKVFLHVDICHILIRGLSWYLSLLSFLHFNKINFIYLFIFLDIQLTFPRDGRAVQRHQHISIIANNDVTLYSAGSTGIQRSAINQSFRLKRLQEFVKPHRTGRDYEEDFSRGR